MTNNRDVATAVILAIALFVAVWLTDQVALRIVLALPLLLFFTGHLALRVIGTKLQPLEYVLASVGMSLVICVAGCFVLYGISALRPIGWASWILVVVLGLSGWITRQAVPGGLVVHWPAMQRWHVATIGTAVLILTGAYGLAIYDEANTREFRYTEFWIVPTKPGKFIIGIKNGEAASETYDISVTTPTGIIAEIHSITIDPGKVWTRTLDSRYRTEATLYLHRGDQGHIVYRRVSAVPNVKDVDVE